MTADRHAASRRGQRRHAAGAAAEHTLDASLAFLERVRHVDGWGDYALRGPGDPPALLVSRAHPPTVGVNGKLRYVGRGGVDYLGLAVIDGQPVPVAFDVKSSLEASFAFPITAMHQARFLAQWDGAGGVGFVLVLDRSEGAAYGLPIGGFDPAWRYRYRVRRKGLWTPAPGVIRLPRSFVAPVVDVHAIVRGLLRGRMARGHDGR